MTLPYAEIGITTNFSFLRGGSDPRAYVHQASDLGLPVIGIADHNSLAGVVRAYKELDNSELRHKPRLLIGSRIVFIDGTPDILVYPRNREAYGRLCQLLTRGKRGDDASKIEKGDCRLTLEDLLEFSEGQLLVLALPHRFDSAGSLRILDRLKEGHADGVWLAASLLYRGDDRRRLMRLHHVASAAHVKLLATNEVLYHDPARRPLQDVLTCIREKTSIDAAGKRLEANAERYLKPAHEMARLFRDMPDAIAETMRFADRIDFSLDQLRYQYPDEPVPPGKTAQQHLEDLTWAGASKCFAGEIEEKVRITLRKELDLIAELKYAHYFLTVHDIVRYARSQKILCQGRGSAANSAVCYFLGITSVDPTKVDLLFERFISKERLEPPDIDVDFEHSRREEVMQYVYRRYGRHRAAIIATVIHYRPRSAIRDVGKALGLTEDVTAALADTVWGSWGSGLNDMQVKQAGLDPHNPMITLAVELASELIEFPRHLSQHVGGYVLTQDRLDSYVPIGNAAMEDRTFIEWDKDDVDALNMMKVDVLALGMLTCIRKCFDLIDDHKSQRWELATIPQDEKPVYDMLCRGESLGVFQVESRAQMNMLPRLKPRTFYDLVIEVAIVRPGPIQGDMVHPYLRRRNGIEKEAYPSPSPEHGPPDELYKVLHKTLGVPLFQEQAMRIAIEAAKFTSEEANGLRRSMATFRNLGTIGSFEDKMIGNMVARGYDPEFAKNCFNQIKGFGSYGFPESHAASFAQLVYVSSWLKHYHPDAFCCGLLNSQPMGFYAPAQIVGDARKNGVEVREIDISDSFAQNTLEEGRGKYCAVRLGFRQIDGFRWTDPDEERLKNLQSSFRGASEASEPGIHNPRARVQLETTSLQNASTGRMDSLMRNCASKLDAGASPRNDESVDDWAGRIVAARTRKPFTSLEDFARETALPKRALILLADADAFRSIGLDRRAALWAVRRLPDDVSLPLFESAAARELPDENAQALPLMPLPEQVVADYQTIRLSLKGHPMEFLRPMFSGEGVVVCEAVAHHNEHRRLRCAGVVLVRQRPGSAKGVVFMTLEDETGIANIVVWPKVMEKFRKEVMGARLVLVEGYIQSSPEKVTHLVAQRLFDRSHDLVGLANDAFQKRPLPAGPALIEPLNDDRREVARVRLERGSFRQRALQLETLMSAYQGRQMKRLGYTTRLSPGRVSPRSRGAILLPWMLIVSIPLSIGSRPAFAADQVHDEIQVYNAEIAAIGQWTYEQHLNFVAVGQTRPEITGGFSSNHALQGTPEFAYGLTDWWEAGFYLPFAASGDGQFLSDGAKIRSLFVVPDAANRSFFYGVNFELGYELPRFAFSPWALEIRPIIGVRNAEWEFIVNPIVDLSFGAGGEADFAPAARLARNLGDGRFLGLEYYADFGRIGSFLPFQQQSQQLFAVTDFKVSRIDVELGAGYGFTPGSDRFVIKAILGYAFPVSGHPGDATASPTPLKMGTPSRAL